MLFCSIEFIFLFMPIFLLIYYTVPEKYGNLILFLGSLFFYAYGDPLRIDQVFPRKKPEMSEDLSGGHAYVWLWHAVYI